MKDEVIKLLKKEDKISDKTLEEISNFQINEFSDIIKDLGQGKTEHIKKEKITDGLNTKRIGKEIYVYKEVMSTNTIAKFLAENDAVDGAVIISEKQTNAKGRSGKPWESPLGGVWLSIILHPHMDPSKTPLITLATGVAVAKTLEKIGVPNAEIKWPNDILIDDKKVSGILTEGIASFNTIETVIIGVGIDVNIDVASLPEELQEGTTSLIDVIGEATDEHKIIQIFLKEFEDVIQLLIDGKFENLLKEWRKRAYTVGKTVEVREPFSQAYEAYVVGINKQGILIVEKTDGTLEKVISGECIIKN